VLQWTDPETAKRRSKSTATSDPAEAEQKRADLEYELNHGLHRLASDMPWPRFRQLFEAEYLTNLRPKTRERYADVLDLFENLARPGKLRSVGERSVSAFAAALRTKPTHGRKGMAPSTIRVTLQFLRTALTWAARQKLLPAVPAFPAVRVPRKKPQPVPAESFERILAAAPDAEMRTFLLAGWLAGLRLSEAMCLSWGPAEDAPYLDLARNRIVLPAEFAKAVEDQWVPVDPILRAALEALPGPHEGRVFRFTSGRSERLIGLTGLSDRVIRLARRAGVRLTMHSLRKGFGCRYAGRVPAQVLQKLMRHANITTTMSYYANVDDAVEAAVLGDRRNTSRNTPPASSEAPPASGDVTPCRR
jgi:integrase